jgi:hypothetical protein
LLFILTVKHFVFNVIMLISEPWLLAIKLFAKLNSLQ